MPDEADADRELTPLLVEDRPVESEPTPLALVLMPDDADVESELTPLLVEDSPVESDVSLL
jgi:hypothetical protein